MPKIKLYGSAASTDSGATLRYLLYWLWRLSGHETLGKFPEAVILIDESDDQLGAVFGPLARRFYINDCVRNHKRQLCTSE